MKAYYFSTPNKTLRYGDGRKIEEGITHTIEGEPKLCLHGLHASKRPLDALRYATGSYLWIVELGGTIVEGEDKMVAAERTYLKGFDATNMFTKFARKVALINIEKIKSNCSESDYKVIVSFLETGDGNIREAAMSAAYAAADAAAYAADATYAAMSAAYAAAAVRAAADAAAVRAAADAVAYAAADDAAAYSKMNLMLEEMIEEALKNIKPIN